jgi:hypothetical protein
VSRLRKGLWFCGCEGTERKGGKAGEIRIRARIFVIWWLTDSVLLEIGN